MDKLQLVINAIQELKSAPIGVNTEIEYKKLINKYDMIFMGKSFNTITSLEFAHYLKEQVDTSITHEYILEVLPQISQMLKLKLETQIKVEDVGKANSKTANYLIQLF